MNAISTIVKVNSSFAQGEQLFDFIKKYAKHSNEHFVWWDEFAFTVESVPESDAILIFNTPSHTIKTLSHPEAVLAFMMEPGVYHKHPWMFRRLDQYARVYSPVVKSSNSITSHGYLGWYFNHSWQTLSELPIPEKTADISCIASGLTQLRGHKLRIAFINMLREKMPQIDFFGKGTRFLPDKLDGLLPYRYSIAIENTSVPWYFTEKINDCFLAYTVPVYYGCTNIAKFFPSKAFISIDITHPAKAIETIRETLANNDWKERLGALQEARHLVLNKYQPLAGAAEILRNISTGVKKEITLHPVLPGFKEKLMGLFKIN